MNKLLKFVSASTLVAFPVVVSAQLNGTRQLIAAVGGLVKSLIIVATAIALLVFIWGLAKFIFRLGGDEKAVDQGKTLMKWGLIALFVLVSVWGIIGFIQGELGLPRSVSPTPNPLSFPMVIPVWP